MSASRRSADDLARLSRLVLGFDHDLWESILSWPVSLEDATHTPLGERTPKYDVDEVLQEVARISKLVRVCKTFHNRYRVRNRRNWLEFVLLLFNRHNELRLKTELSWASGAVVYTPSQRAYMRYVFDRLHVQIRSVRIVRDHTVMAHAVSSCAAEDDLVRHRRFAQRDVRLAFDMTLEVDPESPDPESSWMGMEQLPRSAKSVINEVFDLAKGRVVRAEVSQSPSARSGYGVDCGRVPSLPNGPSQHRTLLWVPSTTNVELVIKVSGGRVRFHGVCDNNSFGFNNRERLAKALAAARAGTILPLPLRRGHVWWKSISFDSDTVASELPNVRVFMPPVRRQPPQPVVAKQGRPPEPDLDEEED